MAVSQWGYAPTSMGGLYMQNVADPDIQATGMQNRMTQAPALANQRDIAGLQSATSLGQAQIAANASMYPAQQQMARFNRVFPVLNSQISSGGGIAPYNPGAGPHITVGGVWNPQQVNQQVNQTRAQNDRSTQTQQAGQAQQLSGRGFGSNSPLLQSLYGQSNANNLATNTNAEQQLRWNAAQGNQQAILNTQQAASQNYGARQNELLQARGQNIGRMNSLIAALAGIV